MSEIETFIRDYCRPSADTIKFLTFLGQFRRKLTAKQNREWPRRRVAAELRRLGHPIGQRSHVLHVAGLAIADESEPAWHVEGGKLVRRAGSTSLHPT